MTAEMAASTGVRGTLADEESGEKEEERSGREQPPRHGLYRWVRYATTPSGPARSIRTNPTRSNWTTLPTASRTTGSQTPARSPSGRRSVQGTVPPSGSHWMIGARAARASARSSPAYANRNRALDCRDVDVEEVLEPEHRDARRRARRPARPRSRRTRACASLGPACPGAGAGGHPAEWRPRPRPRPGPARTRAGPRPGPRAPGSRRRGSPRRTGCRSRRRRWRAWPASRPRARSPAARAPGASRAGYRPSLRYRPAAIPARISEVESTTPSIPIRP